MRARAVVLLACSACSQIFGLDTPQVVAPADAAHTGDATIDAPREDAPPDAMTVTVSFQQGANTYAGAQDTYIDSVNTTTTRNTDTVLRWRIDNRWTLIQFTAIFGAMAGRIPGGASIVSAQLDLMMAGTNCTADIREVNVPWIDTDTYDSFGPAPGVDATDLGPVVNPVPAVSGDVTIDVTSSLVKWRADLTKDHGWIIEGLSGGDCSARSSDDGVVQNRPMLTVTFVP